MPVLVRLTVISPLLAVLLLAMVLILIFSDFDSDSRVLEPVIGASRRLLHFAGAVS